MSDFNNIDELICKVTDFSISTRNYYILDINHHGSGKIIKINDEIVNFIKDIINRNKIDLTCNEVLEDSEEEESNQK